MPSASRCVEGGQQAAWLTDGRLTAIDMAAEVLRQCDRLLRLLLLRLARECELPA